MEMSASPEATIAATKHSCRLIRLKAHPAVFVWRQSQRMMMTIAVRVDFGSGGTSDIPDVRTYIPIKAPAQ